MRMNDSIFTMVGETLDDISVLSLSSPTKEQHIDVYM